MLQETEKYLEKAISLDKGNVDYWNELGSEKLNQEKLKEASKSYSAALKIDPTNAAAVLGKLKCQILEDKLDDVEQQFELLSEAMPNLSSNPVNVFILKFVAIINFTNFYVNFFKGISVFKSIFQQKTKHYREKH